jgi:hypothetical protein
LIPYLHETSAVENYVHGLRADHYRALRDAEQKGYDSGLRDAKEWVIHTLPPTPATILGEVMPSTDGGDHGC